MALDYDDYRVAWICALPKELAAAKLMLDEEYPELSRKPHDNNVYIFGRVGAHRVVAGCLPSGRTGTTPAAQVASHLRVSFPRIEVALLVGIGGGAPSKENDIRLGDVIVSSPVGKYGGVIQYDFGKTVRKGVFQFASHSNKPPTLLLSAVSKLRAKHIVEAPVFHAYVEKMSRRHPNFASPRPKKDTLYHADYDHPEHRPDCDRCDKTKRINRPVLKGTNPAVYYGLIASANEVMRHGATRNRLQDELNVLSFEMEAAGMMDDFPCLVVRGCADYSDSHKNKAWQLYAALTAAAYAKELLENIPVSFIADDVSPYQSSALTQSSREKWQLETRVGCGKTILCTHAINHLQTMQENTSPKPSLIAHFFVDPSDMRTLDGGYLLASLSKQLLEHAERCGKLPPDALRRSLKHLFATSGLEPDFGDHMDIFLAACDFVEEWIIIIDGLDELKHETISAVLRVVERVLADCATSCKIMIASRSDLGLNNHIFAPFHIAITADDSSDDIRTYIESNVTWRMCHQRPITKKTSILANIKKRLLEESRGMILWIVLQLEALWSDCLTDGDIVHALDNLPRDLSQTYERCLRRVPAAVRTLTPKVLQWVASASRPLLMKELREAVTFNIDDAEWDEARLPSELAVVSSCANLLMEDASDTSVFVHPSVKQFLSADAMTESEFYTVDSNIQQTKCGEFCVAYLSFKDFGLQLQRYSVSTNTIAVPFASTAFSMLRLPSYATSFMVQKQIPKVKPFQMRVPMSKAATGKSTEEAKYGFLDYAREHWALQSTKISLASSPVRERFEQLALQLALKDGDTQKVHDIWDKPYALDGLPPLHAAARLGHRDICIALSGKCSRALVGCRGRTPIWYAAEKGRKLTMEVLLDPDTLFRDATRLSRLQRTSAISKFANYTDEEGISPLAIAARNGHYGVISQLSTCRASDLRAGSIRLTALYAAASQGHYQIVDLLLLREPENRYTHDERRHIDTTALHAAAEHGYANVVELIANKQLFRINALDGHGDTPLHLATKAGHTATVRSLLRHGAKATPTTQDGMTALHIASSSGDSDMADEFYQRRNDTIDINAVVPTSLDTSLHLAARAGHYEVIQSLLKYENVDVNKRNRLGETPLLCAIHGLLPRSQPSQAVANPETWRLERVVALLLDHKEIDPNSSSNAMILPPIHASVALASEWLVERVVMHPRIAINARDAAGYTALHLAIQESDNDAVLGLLLQHKEIDLNATITKVDYEAVERPMNAAEACQMALMRNRRHRKGETLLETAVTSSNAEMPRLLTQDQRLDINQLSPHGEGAIHIAAEENDAALVSLLLKREDINVNRRNGKYYTPLAVAAMKGHSSILGMLLSHPHISVNSSTPDHNWAAIYAVDLALQQAAKSGAEKDSDSVALLLAHPTARLNNQVQCSLSRAIHLGLNAIVVQMLTSKHLQADLNECDGKGLTPLLIAARCEQNLVVKLLLDSGSNPAGCDGYAGDHLPGQSMVTIMEQTTDEIKKLIWTAQYKAGMRTASDFRQHHQRAPVVETAASCGEQEPRISELE